MEILVKTIEAKNKTMKKTKAIISFYIIIDGIAVAILGAMVISFFFTCNAFIFVGFYLKRKDISEILKALSDLGM
ncbi:MAG: hypothetical protein OXJ52_01520 [Oligoflexia bacterium]|nr:hypothetical protein [Oligoflexia bacterium]